MTWCDAAAMFHETSMRRRELAHRANQGIDVYLFVWYPEDDSLAVTVVDESGESFEPRRRPGGGARGLRASLRAYAAYRGLLEHAGVAA